MGRRGMLNVSGTEKCSCSSGWKCGDEDGGLIGW